jgi:hypothetical protein
MTRTAAAGIPVTRVMPLTTCCLAALTPVVAQHAMGTFVADGTTQDLTIDGVGSGGNVLNAYQIRLVPESVAIVLSVSRAPGTDELIFTWNSRSGMVYDLLSATGLASSPDTWGVWDGNEGISATPDQNTLTIARPGDGIRFFAVAERALPPETLLTEGFDGVTPPALPGTGNTATSRPATPARSASSGPTARSSA